MTNASESPYLEWAVEMPLLTNRFFLYDALKLILWTGAVMYALLAAIALFAGTLRHMGTAFLGMGLVLAGFLFLFLVIAAVFFRNRFPMQFRISPEGIEWHSLSRRARTANRMAMVAGVLTGSSTAAGAGLLAASEEFGGLEWSRIGRVKTYADERVITVMNSWRVVARLYCTPENYVRAAQLVDWYVRMGGGATMGRGA